MTIHRPGLPEDLPPGEELWARWALLAAVKATTEQEECPSVHRSGHWIDEEGLHWDDCGCTWWILSRMGEGRFVLYGEDESSDVKWHEPPVDMLAGGPDWLPYEELRYRLEGNELGCVYWYENGAWSRAPYPDSLKDDGLDCGMNDLVDRAGLLRELALYIDDTSAAPLLAAAEAYALDAELLLERLRTHADGEPVEPPAVARALDRTGITTSQEVSR
ncbi:hypothetical protein [Streptomyces lanatus]|uniref:Uncharacterized protein n=1 Tax=Streptomyces lanatus TaxID=66900 RepID=A0ABV1XQF7_9ACTN|nr:hypothetical protein [Streptomyces lanatus]GHG89024.1 hypothetical protein GCM10018780_07910 [Streptomyces lanatus]